MEGLPARAALLHSGSRAPRGLELGATPYRGGKSCKVCGVRFRPRRAILRKEVRAMAIIPEKYLDLLQRKKAFANLATLMPDGSPQVTPACCDSKHGLVPLTTPNGR